MAVTGNSTGTLSVTANGITQTPTMQVAVSTTGNELLDATQLIGTSAEAITLGDISTPAELWIKHVGTANYVEVDSADTFDKFPQKLTAGQWIKLLPQTGTIYAKANTAAVRIRKVAYEPSA